MATCIECSKGWNSWGSYDEFCSDACENIRENRDKELSNKLVSSLNNEQIELLKRLLESSIGIGILQYRVDK